MCVCVEVVGEVERGSGEEEGGGGRTTRLGLWMCGLVRVVI